MPVAPDVWLTGGNEELSANCESRDNGGCMRCSTFPETGAFVAWPLGTGLYSHPSRSAHLLSWSGSYLAKTAISEKPAFLLSAPTFVMAISIQVMVRSGKLSLNGAPRSCR